jgi:type II secretory pathway component PulK
LLAAVLVLTLLFVVYGLQAQQLTRARRQLQFEERRIQLGWLAESGLERAAVRLGEDQGYTGESWEISGKTLGRVRSVNITIGVKRAIGRGDFYLLEAIAEERASTQKGLIARRYAKFSPVEGEP